MITLQERGVGWGHRRLSMAYLAFMTHATLKDEKMSKYWSICNGQTPLDLATLPRLMTPGAPYINIWVGPGACSDRSLRQKND